MIGHALKYDAQGDFLMRRVVRQQATETVAEVGA